eukprot:5991432-Amphidinium_carterae.2
MSARATQGVIMAEQAPHPFQVFLLRSERELLLPVGLHGPWEARDIAAQFLERSLVGQIRPGTWTLLLASLQSQ